MKFSEVTDVISNKKKYQQIYKLYSLFSVQNRSRIDLPIDTIQETDFS